MVSSVTTGPGVRHAVASKVVIMVQSFVILSLTYWIVEEYLNNMYLRQYVSDAFQADGLIFGVLGTLLFLGSTTGLFLKHRHGRSTVSLDIKTPSPIVNAAKKEEKKKTDGDFHPVVAALKADMADRRLSFGSIAGAGTEQTSTVPVSGAEVRRTSVLDQLAQNRQIPVTGPRPGQIGTPVSQQPIHDFASQAGTGPRIEQGGTLAQRPLPFLRPPESAGSTVLQPSRPPAPPIPTNVTTVITGIMPAQKKKDPNAAPEEKPSSQ